jgi:hypothetical protein
VEGGCWRQFELGREPFRNCCNRVRPIEPIKYPRVRRARSAQPPWVPVAIGRNPEALVAHKQAVSFGHLGDKLSDVLIGKLQKIHESEVLLTARFRESNRNLAQQVPKKQTS